MSQPERRRRSEEFDEDEYYDDALMSEPSAPEVSPSPRRYRAFMSREMRDETRRSLNPFYFLEDWEKELSDFQRYLIFIEAAFTVSEQPVPSPEKVPSHVQLPPSVVFKLMRAAGFSEDRAWRFTQLGFPSTVRDLERIRVALGKGSGGARAIRSVGAGRSLYLLLSNTSSGQRVAEGLEQLARSEVAKRQHYFLSKLDLIGWGWVYGADAIGYIVGKLRDTVRTARLVVSSLADELNLPAELPAALDRLGSAAEELLDVLFDPRYVSDYDNYEFYLTEDAMEFIGARPPGEMGPFLIEELNVETGQVVKAGDIICRLRCKTTRARAVVRYRVSYGGEGESEEEGEEGEEEPIVLPLVIIVYDVPVKRGDTVSEGDALFSFIVEKRYMPCLLYTSPSPRDRG